MLAISKKFAQFSSQNQFQPEFVIALPFENPSVVLYTFIRIPKNSRVDVKIGNLVLANGSENCYI